MQCLDGNRRLEQSQRAQGGLDSVGVKETSMNSQSLWLGETPSHIILQLLSVSPGGEVDASCLASCFPCSGSKSPSAS